MNSKISITLLLYLRLNSVQGFPLYEDTDFRRAATHQLYFFAIEVGFGANAPVCYKQVEVWYARVLPTSAAQVSGPSAQTKPL